jgi:prepilin-type N-terminal cleavage/methylation domain-containing protein
MQTRNRRRGFSLIELMIALLVCAFGVAAAAKISSSAVRSSRRGTEAVDLGQRARLISRQLRVDLRLAGEGSTGAIGVAASPPWTALSANYHNVTNGEDAIPAISGANNITSVGLPNGATTPPWPTDAIMLVVPDAATHSITAQPTASGIGAQIQLIGPDFPPCATPGACPAQCPSGFVYIADHAAATGAGKSQIANISSITQGGGPVGAQITLADNLMFDVSPSAEVMCARVTTYLIAIPAAGSGSTIPWLMRSDLSAAGGTSAIGGGGSGQVFVNTNAIEFDSPGVWDLQVAYAFSSENTTVPSGRNTVPSDRWAFANPNSYSAGATSPFVGGNCNWCGWFEVREVRYSMLVGSVRALLEKDQIVGEAAAEDGPLVGPNAGQITMPIEVGRYRLTAGETLQTLRMFDKALPSGQGIATPY